MNVRDIISTRKNKIYLIIAAIIVLGVLFAGHGKGVDVQSSDLAVGSSTEVSVNSLEKTYNAAAKKALAQMTKNQPVKAINETGRNSGIVNPADKDKNGPTGIKDVRVQEPLSPYLDHPLKNHLAYRIADRLAKARERHNVKDAEKALMDLFKQINLGVYTVDGRQILAGAERNQNDFFLYQYQVRILARSYVNGNVSSLNHELNVIPVVIFKMKLGSTNEALVANAVASAMTMRYQQAEMNPEKPGNFIPLVIDGLARHQVSPYSLDELNDSSFSYEHADFDDIQTLLMMLDLVIPAPNNHNGKQLASLFGMIPSAHAGSICDGIVGDGLKAHWASGHPWIKKIITGILPGKAVKKILAAEGKITKHGGMLGDFLILRGIYLKIVPHDTVIPLPHDIKPQKAYMSYQLPQYHLKAIATFKVGISNKIAKCGWLLGKKIPKNGPLKNVDISWSFEPSLTIDPKLKTTTYANDPNVQGAGGGLESGMRMLTDKNGTATLSIGALPCPHPNGRYLNGRHYVVTAAARYVSAQMPNYSALISPEPEEAAGDLAVSMIPGFYEIATGGRKAYATIEVTWHEKNDPRKQQY